MIPWWEKYGGEVYRREVLELRDYVGEFEEVYADGKFIVKAQLTVDEKLVPATIIYPDNYPYFPAGVFAPGLNRPRHYEPVSGNMCLLQRGTRNWSPQWTMAQMIREQLPYWEVLSKGGAEEAHLAERDDEQAEPATALYSYAEGGVLVAEDVNVDPSIESGTLTVGFRQKPQVAFANCVVEGAVVELRDNKKRIQRWFPDALKQIYESQYPHFYEAPWVRLPEAPPLSDGKSALGFLKRVNPILHHEVIEKASKHKGGIVGFLVPLEVRKGDPCRNGWFFMAWAGKGKV